MAKDPVPIETPREGVITDPDYQLRVEVSALGWFLASNAYSREAWPAHALLAEAEARLRKIRLRYPAATARPPASRRRRKGD